MSYNEMIYFILNNMKIFFSSELVVLFVLLYLIVRLKKNERVEREKNLRRQDLIREEKLIEQISNKKI